MRSCRLIKCNLFSSFLIICKNENVFSSRIKSLLKTGITQLCDRFSTGTMEGTNNKIQNEIKESLTDSEIKIIYIQNYGYTSGVVCFIQMNQN